MKPDRSMLAIYAILIVAVGWIIYLLYIVR